MLTKFHLMLKNWTGNFQAQEKRNQNAQQESSLAGKDYTSNSVKYLGVKIDENLNWKDDLHDIAAKPNRANALLFKIRNYVDFNTLKSTYFAIFDSHINFGNLLWGQSLYSAFRLVTLEKKAIIIIISLEIVTQVYYLKRQYS